MLAVYFDQQPQPLSDDPAADGSFNYSLPESQPGQSLTFGLRNTTDQPVGVVLLVNGVSTLYLLEGEPADLTKWVLEPRKEYRVKGFTIPTAWRPRCRVVDGASRRRRSRAVHHVAEMAHTTRQYVTSLIMR